MCSRSHTWTWIHIRPFMVCLLLTWKIVTLHFLITCLCCFLPSAAVKPGTPARSCTIFNPLPYHMSAVKGARRKHLSNLIESNCHNSYVLLSLNLFLTALSPCAQRHPLKCEYLTALFGAANWQGCHYKDSHLINQSIQWGIVTTTFGEDLDIVISKQS